MVGEGEGGYGSAVALRRGILTPSPTTAMIASGTREMWRSCSDMIYPFRIWTKATVEPILVQNGVCGLYGMSFFVGWAFPDRNTRMVGREGVWETGCHEFSIASADHLQRKTIMTIEAIIFDMDGTLMETEEQWDGVRRQLAADAGLPWPEGATQAMMGMSTPEWSEYLATSVGLPMSADQAAERTIDAMAAHHRTGVELLPGAIESVRRMAGHYRIAIASSSPRRLIDAGVEAMGIGDLLGATVSTEEVALGKPAPDGFLRAARLLGVEPEACVAVEDSTNGVLSALAAGMTVVCVPPAFHPPAPDVLARATVLSSLDELTVDLVKHF